MLREPACLVALGCVFACASRPEPTPDFFEVKPDTVGRREGGSDRDEGRGLAADGVEEEERRRFEEGGGASDGDSAPAPAGSAPAEASATVRLDGADLDVRRVALWPPDREGLAHVFIEVEGRGAPAGTDLHITFTRVARGCVASPNPARQDLWLRPPATGDQFRSSDGAACGLEITSFPAAVGHEAVGFFAGTVAGINGARDRTHELDVRFRLTRTK